MRTVLVLNDGKIGHLNQSLAIARQIQKARMTQGYKPDDTKIIVADVKFKNGYARTLLSICASFSTWRCHGCMRCMKLCLEKKTYKFLIGAYSEFIVSCGSSLEAVNIFMSKENNAKNVVVMKPNIAIGLNKFSLAVIPKHDRPPKAKNVVETTIAPNLIDEEKLRIDRERLRTQVHLETDSAIGLFVGGNNPEFALTKEVMNSVIDNLVEFSTSHNAAFLVTTSRRTPKAAENLLKERLKNDPRCKMLVIANEKNLEEAVGGILGLSRVVVVSEESVSMISEAVSACKRTIVFELAKKKRGMTKHEVALRGLEKDGYVTISSLENLRANMEKAWSDNMQIEKLRDKERIFEAVRRLI